MPTLRKGSHRLTGRRTARPAAPLWLATGASVFALAWGRLRGKKPKFTPAAVEAIGMHRRISGEKARRELGYQPRPFEQTLSDTLAWFAAEGLLERR